MSLENQSQKESNIFLYSSNLGKTKNIFNIHFHEVKWTVTGKKKITISQTEAYQCIPNAIASASSKKSMGKRIISEQVNEIQRLSKYIFVFSLEIKLNVSWIKIHVW